MLRRYTGGFLLCLAAWSAAGTAQAQVQASMSLGAVGYTLVDLNPDDGVAPELIWLDERSEHRLHLSLYSVNGLQTFLEVVDGPGAWSDSSAITYRTFSLAMDDDGVRGAFQAPLGGEVNAYARIERGFTLSPFTAVTFYAAAQLDGTAEIPAGAPYPNPRNRPYIEGGFGAELSGDFDHVREVNHTSLGASLDLDQAGPASLNKSQDGLLVLTLHNTDDFLVTGELSASASFWARTSPVPEAGTMAQMLLGLLALAGLVSVRQRHQRRRALQAGLACLGMMVGASASAQVATTVSLSNLGYVLIDLDPDDGITPALTWLDESRLGNGIHVSEQLPPWRDAGGTPNFGPAMSRYEIFEDQPDATSQLVEGPFRTSVSREGGSVSLTAPLGASLNLSATYQQGFELTPNTLVTFTGDLYGAFGAHVPAGASYPNGYFDWAYVAVEAAAELELISRGDLVQYSRLYRGFTAPVNTPVSVTETMVSVSFANTLDRVQDASLSFRVFADGYTVRPIPEASTWAQMTLGGGLLWAAVRRRRSRLSARIPG